MKIAINGFGRIGRAIFKIALDRGLHIVAVNDIHGAEAASYSLAHDSVYGKYNRSVTSTGDTLIVDKKKVLVLGEKDPTQLPWKKLGVDVVIESTGVFTKGNDARKHLDAGAKHVIITAPAERPDCTLVPGVNNSVFKKQQIISVGSCTTNCAATVLQVLLNSLGISYAMLTTVHAYTNDQVVLDNPHHSTRRGRAAGLNIIPTTTGAAEAVIQAMPQLKGKLTGLSIRVPVPCGSLVDLTVEVKKKTTIKDVNTLLKKASKDGMKGLIEYSEDPLVSSDIIGNTHSAIIDGLSTQVDGDLVKVLAWYDNETGYSSRVVDVIQRLR